MESTAPVLIVGAGPSGLYLALALVKNGINVRIIEQDKTFHIGSRGAGIQPRTLEQTELLGVFDDLSHHANFLPKARAYKPGPLEQAEVLKTWNFVDKVEPTPAIPHAMSLVLNQNVHEGVIRDHLKAYGCQVELGTKLVSFEQDEQGVVAKVRRSRMKDVTVQEDTIRASYLVGADGARGTVRKLLNLAFMGETRDADAMVVADVETKNLSSDCIHLWENRTNDDSLGNMDQRVFARPFNPENSANTSFNIILIGSYSTEEMQKIGTDPEAMRNAFYATTGRTDVKFDKVSWLSYFRPSMRMVNKFGEGRVFVVGDAAHVHPPSGGQGLNSGVQDSLNLAWKLSLVLKKLAPPFLLDTFTEERLPVIKEMLRRTTGLYDEELGGEKKDKGNTSGTSTGEKNEEVAGAWKRDGVLYMLEINYRWSSIVLEEREKREMSNEEMKAHAYGGYEGGICAGDRAPDAPGLRVSQSVEHLAGKIKDGKASLFKLMDTAKHTILIFVSSPFSSQVEDTVHAIGLFRAAKETIQTFLVSRSSPSDGSYNSDKGGVDATLADIEGHAHDAYLVKDGEFTVVIIRPDGYVGAITRDVGGVEKYFRNFLQG